MSKTFLAYVRKVKVFFLRRKQNSPISSQAIASLCKECNHATCTGDKYERSQCGIDHATYDLLTCQHTKTPELCSVSCGDEFDLEFNWNEAL